MLVRLQRTPIAPRLPAPSLSPPPQQPRRNPFEDMGRDGPAGVAATRPVRFSEDWKRLFKQAGVRKSDLSDPVKAMRIAMALAESWDAKAWRPGFIACLAPTQPDRPIAFSRAPPRLRITGRATGDAWLH